MNLMGAKLDTILTGYARLLGAPTESFIADKAFPVVDVPTKSGQFYNVAGGFGAASPGSRPIITDGKPAPDVIDVAVSRITGWEVDLNGVGVQVSAHSAEYLSGNGLDLEQAKVAVLNRYNYILRERIAAGIAFSATVFSGYTAALAAADRWDVSTSDPVGDAQDAIDLVQKATGERPNSLIVGYSVHKALRQHPAILEFLSRTVRTTGLVSESDIAQALDIQNYYVGGAVANSAVEGQTATNAYIWGNSALFCTLRPSPQAMTPQSALQRWRFRGSQDGSVMRWQPTPYMTQLDQLWNDQFGAPTPAAGYLYTTVTA